MVWIDLTHIHQTLLQKHGPGAEEKETPRPTSPRLDAWETVRARWPADFPLQQVWARAEAAVQQERRKEARRSDALPPHVAFGLFLLQATPHVDRYRTVIKAHKKVSFVDNGNAVAPPDSTEDRVAEILSAYRDVLLRYYPAEIDFCSCEGTEDDNARTTRRLLSRQRQERSTTCSVCNSSAATLMDVGDRSIVCEQCGFVTAVDSQTLQASFKDMDRVNLSCKYQYDRITHFRDCMNQFQGKQNALIDRSVFEALRYQFVQHGLAPANYADLPKEVAFRSVTKEHILLFLKETGNTKHYDDVALIHFELSGKRPPDISHLENALLQDFHKLTTLYDKKHRQSKRKNFINTGYILFQLLRRHKFPCRKEDFNILKTIDRKYYHDNIAKALFEELGWNFVPTF